MIPTFAYFTSTQDWLIIAGLAVLLFGGAKLPQLAKGLGEGIREFKKSVNGEGESSSTSSSAPRNDAPAETATSGK